MVALLLAFILSQTPAIAEGGRITGTLRTLTGEPLRGVRVAASVSDSTNATTTLVSLGETDAEGRFVLENVPPGRYRIMAGRIDAPTFYPGSLDAASGTILTVSAGSVLSGIDFVVAGTSLAPAAPAGPAGRRTSTNKVEVLVPLTVTVEGGGTLPGGRMPTIQLIPVAGGKNLEKPISSKGIAIPVTEVTEEYRVRVDNLPDGYQVKSITFGSTDLTTDTLKASLSELSPMKPRIVTYTGQGELQGVIDQIMARRNGASSLSIVLIPKAAN